MKAHVALVSSEYGPSVLYVGASEDAATTALAEWCRSYWHQEGVDVETEVDEPKELDDSEVIRLYFAAEGPSGKCEMGSIETTEFQE